MSMVVKDFDGRKNYGWPEKLLMVAKYVDMTYAFKRYPCLPRVKSRVPDTFWVFLTNSSFL